MPSLAIFDFDRTVILDDSDATIINALHEKPPPEFEACNKDWTEYMSVVFEHAYIAGLTPEQILTAIAEMRPTPGVQQLITTLAAEGWQVLILSDANSVFVKHWLEVHGLQDAITAIITNHSYFKDGRLFIEPCMRQSTCSRCPSNLCKSIALKRWFAEFNYDRIAYTGDGRNDYCPVTNLPADAIAFPRRGYPLDDLTKKTLASPCPEVKAKVVPWDDCYRILQELFPELSRSIPAIPCC